MLGSKVGMGKTSVDAETNEIVRRFAGLEGQSPSLCSGGCDQFPPRLASDTDACLGLTEYTAKLVKDTSAFRDAVASTSNGSWPTRVCECRTETVDCLASPSHAAMLTSQTGFATAFTTLFSPLQGETSLTATHPYAETTLRNIDQYQEFMVELREAIEPEIELVDARVTAPLKEYQELLKKIRKTITKREHKVRVVLLLPYFFSLPTPAALFPRSPDLTLRPHMQLVDYDRHNNSYNKLKDKKEKSLSDEKNLFKYEQELELATQEYEHYNGCVRLHSLVISPLPRKGC